MSALRFELFGKLSMQRDAQALSGLDGRKEQELLCYLLLRRDRPHPRESLASLLWGEASTERSRKYLRQALWHLHSSLEVDRSAQKQVLLVEHDWVQLSSQSDLWLDVTVFEQAFTATRGVPGKQLDSERAETLKSAVELYKGDLLDGWYYDWCLFERERLQNIYLSMLDKLMSYSMEHHEYETGLSYGSAILQYDRASERTYRRLMMMKYSAGDRTGALRLYERCVAALNEDLAVKPDRRTKAVYEHIRADGMGTTKSESARTFGDNTSLTDVLDRLKRLQLVLTAVQKRIQRDISAVERLKTPK
jgi:DNA-binding SARP family transcriptional activator